MEKKLKTLDFGPGIKASEINYNFETVKGWLDRERLRLGGPGIVEGFDITADTNTLKVSVTDGTFINKQGQEQIIPARIFDAGDINAKQITETIVCPKDGYLTLQYVPYSKTNKKHIVYDNIDQTTTRPLETELEMHEIESGLHVPVIKVSENKVYINAGDWLGQQIKVTYYKAEDRIDSIILTQDGEYKYEKSVISTSPSHIQIPDYAPDYLIGQIYWHVDGNIEATIYTNHRTYRKLFVDKDGILWINGEPYKKPKFIYFIEPEHPEENDIWYDEKNNELLIWKATNGVYGWVKINDHSTMAINNSYMFIPGEKQYPTNDQTFIFPEDRIDMNYVPGTDSLLILIDNIVIMKDQYEEIVANDTPDKPYLAKGIGFKLVEPLDRSTPVQAIVHHQVASANTNETFQRAAVFVNENHIYYSADHTNKVFETEEDYQVGENQLEVWVDGLRLVYDIDFKEMKNETETVDKNDMSVRDIMSRHFKIIKPLTINQCIEYKISKHIWNYDQLSLVMKETLDTIKAVQEDNKRLHTELDTFKENQADTNTSISNRINTVEQSIPDTSNVLTTNSIIDISQLSNKITNRMVTENPEEYLILTAQKTNTINDYGINDFIVIFYVSENDNRVLIKDADYTIDTDSVAVPNANIILKDYLVKAGATIYINRLKVGGRRG